MIVVLDSGGGDAFYDWVVTVTVVTGVFDVFDISGD